MGKVKQQQCNCDCVEVATLPEDVGPHVFALS